jgi:serine protease AprX
VTVPDLPLGADGLARAIVAFDDGVLDAGVLDLLTFLGVVRGIELASIDAVAVTAPVAVLDAIALLPGVRAVEPQRRLALDLYVTKEQINAVGVDAPEDYQADVGGVTTPAQRPGVTGDGVVVAVLDSGIFADHPDFVTGSRRA